MKKILILGCLLTISLFPSYAQGDFEIEKFLDGTIINDIEGDGDYIWLATEGKGVIRYDKKNDSWDNLASNNPEIQQEYIYCLASDKNFVWAGSVDGLLMLDKRSNRWTRRKFSVGGQLSNWIRSIAYDPFEKVVWIGRFQYLTKYDIQRRRFVDYDLTVSGNKKTNTIKTIAVDGDSLVWFGTEGGLHKYDKSKNLEEPNAVVLYDSKLHYFNGEGDEISITSLLLEQNNIWIGLDEFRTEDNPNYNLGGLYRFDRRNDWYRFDNTLGFQANGVFALERIGDYILASLYQFGKNTKSTYGRGLTIVDRRTMHLDQISDDRLPMKILSIYFDGEYLWLGSDSGVYRIKFSTNILQWDNEE